MSDNSKTIEEGTDVKKTRDAYFRAIRRSVQDDANIGAYDNVEDLINSPVTSGVILKNKRAFDRYCVLFRNLSSFYMLHVPGDLLENYLNGDDKNRASIDSNTEASLGIDITDTAIIGNFAATHISRHADLYEILEKILVMLYIKDSLKPKLAELSKILRYNY
jgi:hypothetical protein